MFETETTTPEQATETPSTQARWTWKSIVSNVAWIVIPLLIGLFFSMRIPLPEHKVGIITLNSAIDSYSAKDLITQFEYARSHAEISAVVLVLDSPGGTVVDIENAYLELLKLRKTKPVVASIDSMAASGAYYLTAGSDYAFAKPTSNVGNIGVIGYLPPTPTIYEEVISTGPYKLFGMPRDTTMRQIEMIKKGFYDAVVKGRGERLKAGPDVVLSGQIWPGSEALQLGLIDALGTQSDAIEKAARLANIAGSDTVDLGKLALTPTPAPVAPAGTAPVGFFAISADGKTTAYPREAGIYLLYIPPTQSEQK